MGSDARRRRAVLISLLTISLGACGSGIEPAGEAARRIDRLTTTMFWLGLIPMVVVVGIIVAIVLWRRRHRSPVTERHFVMGGGVVFSILLLVPVIVLTAVTQLNLGIDGDDRLEIEITGHQWWWDIRYVTDDGMVRTANELHVPTDTPIDLRLTSADVIHSVWIPELHGKIDLIPDQVNTLEIHVDEPGVYEGNCAEFCGIAHALMRLLVVAHPPAEFETWLAEETAPPQVDVDIATMQEFANSCAPCHTVRGLFDDHAYEGDFGPDLTHLASRRMIGANILPNTPEALARWIVDPEGAKPGNRMPDVGLDAEELTQILDLLRQLDGHG